MFILGLDLGTICGCADGAPDAKPRSWTINLEDAGHGRPARLALWQKWLEGYFKHLLETGHQPLELKVVYEQPLTLAALISMVSRQEGATTNDQTITLHRGLVGILEAVAFNHGIRHIEPVDVHQARRALTKDYRASKEKVFEFVWMLGWRPENHEESDAMCVWSYGCGSIKSTPLFAGR
jgi:hypothetical protein